MILDRPRLALLARISQLLLLAKILVLAQGYPFGNASLLEDARERDSVVVSKRAGQNTQVFDPLPGFPHIKIHSSCKSKERVESFREMLENVQEINEDAVKASQRTLDIIKDRDPKSFQEEERRLMDVFMASYGEFNWNQDVEVNRAIARAERLHKFASDFYQGLKNDLMHINILCDSSEWELYRFNSNIDAWRIKHLPIGPRMKKKSNDVCIMPGGQTARGFNQDAPYDTPKSSYVTLCQQGFDKFKYPITRVKASGFERSKQHDLQSIITRTPEMLLIHEISHSGTYFGNWKTVDAAYGWTGIVRLALKSRGSNSVSTYQPLLNADTYAYWACAVYLNWANWGDGKCNDPKKYSP